MDKTPFKKLTEHIFVHTDYVQAFEQLGLTTIDSVFNFSGGTDLKKENLTPHRARIRFQLSQDGPTLYLKRYDRPCPVVQIRNWLSHMSRQSTASFDKTPVDVLSKANIKTAKVVAYGEQWGKYFEKRSFVITEEIENAEALERKLPDCFHGPSSPESFKKRIDFINKLADFARVFHNTGLRHRDFYLAHIFLDTAEQLYLIDLQRTFEPRFFKRRFQLKDLAQLHYSSPGKYITCTDRIRFYLRYRQRTKLSRTDKYVIKKIKKKAWQMALHDIKHNRPVPFAS